MIHPEQAAEGAGFTLVEVLVSLLLCALLATAIATAVTFSGRTGQLAGRMMDAALLCPTLYARQVRLAEAQPYAAGWTVLSTAESRPLPDDLEMQWTVLEIRDNVRLLSPMMLWVPSGSF